MAPAVTQNVLSPRQRNTSMPTPNQPSWPGDSARSFPTVPRNKPLPCGACSLWSSPYSRRMSFEVASPPRTGRAAEATPSPRWQTGRRKEAARRDWPAPTPASAQL